MAETTEALPQDQIDSQYPKQNNVTDNIVTTRLPEIAQESVATSVLRPDAGGDRSLNQISKERSDRPSEGGHSRSDSQEHIPLSLSAIGSLDLAECQQQLQKSQNVIRHLREKLKSIEIQTAQKSLQYRLLIIESNELEQRWRVENALLRRELEVMTRTSELHAKSVRHDIQRSYQRKISSLKRKLSTKDAEIREIKAKAAQAALLTPQSTRKRNTNPAQNASKAKRRREELQGPKQGLFQTTDSRNSVSERGLDALGSLATRVLSEQDTSQTASIDGSQSQSQSQSQLLAQPATLLSPPTFTNRLKEETQENSKAKDLGISEDRAFGKRLSTQHSDTEPDEEAASLKTDSPVISQSELHHDFQMRPRVLDFDQIQRNRNREIVQFGEMEEVQEREVKRESSGEQRYSALPPSPRASPLK